MALRLLLFTVLGTLMLLSGSLSAQRNWSLNSCIEFAIENNLGVKQSAGSVRLARVNQLNAKESRYPNFNFATNYGFRFGRTIDPTTNAFENAALNTNGFSINSGMLLYNGNRLNNIVKQSSLELSASQKDNEQFILDLSLEVASAYLNVLLGKETMRVAENNLSFSKEQLTQIRTLVRNGARPVGDFYEAESQVLADEQVVVNSKNAVFLGLLALAQLMQLESYDDFDIVDIELEPDETVLLTSRSQIISNALNSQPGIAASRFRMESSTYGSRIAKSAYYPTLSVFANLNTNFSSLSRKVDRFETVLSPGTPVLINGELSLVEFFQLSPVLVGNPYFNQLNENLGVGIGVQLSIPIYDQGRIRADVNRAHVQEQLAGIQKAQVEQQVRNNVERAVADAVAGRASFEAASKAFVAASRSLEDAEKRYESGNISLFEFNAIRNRHQTAQVNKTRSKFDYIFRLKVLDFYSGNQIGF